MAVSPEAVEGEHAIERAAEGGAQLRRRCKRAADGIVDERRIGIDSADGVEREEPLDEVVDRFEAIVIPAEDFVDRPAAVVAAAAVVEGDKRRRIAYDDPPIT